MNNHKLLQTVNELMAGDKGLLAMDESNPTCNARFKQFGIDATEENRRAYRELLISTRGLKEYISGAILYDETIRQVTLEGTPMARAVTAAGIIPGIKVDTGAKAMAGQAGEKITEGLDNLRERLEEYSTMGARFAKWRMVITIGKNTPTLVCIEENASALARYARLCQEVGLVPIVEPEVMMDGDHSIEDCSRVTGLVLREVFHKLNGQGALLEGLILKPNMILPGLNNSNQNSVDEVAAATMSCLLRNVPAAVGGIAFLSGGQSANLASHRLNAISTINREKGVWPLTFSFSRALQLEALEIWSGKESKTLDAQNKLFESARRNSLARSGHFSNTY